MKMGYLFSFILGCWSIIAFGCKTPTNTTTNSYECVKYYDSTLHMDIYSQVDEMPMFSGGTHNLMKFIREETDLFVKSKQTVYLYIIVDSSGQIIDKRISNREDLSISKEEEEKLLKPLDKLPKCTPGKCNGVSVPVRMLIPIRE